MSLLSGRNHFHIIHVLSNVLTYVSKRIVHAYEIHLICGISGRLWLHDTKSPVKYRTNIKFWSSFEYEIDQDPWNSFKLRNSSMEFYGISSTPTYFLINITPWNSTDLATSEEIHSIYDVQINSKTYFSFQCDTWHRQSNITTWQLSQKYISPRRWQRCVLQLLTLFPFIFHVIYRAQK